MIFQYFSYMSMVRDELLLPGVFLKEKIYIVFLCFHGTCSGTYFGDSY